MPQLLILRHEEALSMHPEGDALRPLTARGRRRMHAQSRALFDALPGLDRIFCSPLVRATQTAEILVNGFDLDTPVYSTRVISEPESLAELSGLMTSQPAPIGVVAMVGHEPTVSTLVEHLLGAPARGFRTGEAVLVEPHQGGWRLVARWHGGLRDPTGPAASAAGRDADR